MSTNDASPPDQIPVGLGTQAGLGATGVMWLVTLISAIANGHLSADSRATLITGGAALLVTIIGRFAQATAAKLAHEGGITAARVAAETTAPNVTVHVNGREVAKAVASETAKASSVSADDPPDANDPADDLPPELSENVPLALTPDIPPPDEGDKQSSSANGEEEVPA